VGKGSAGVAKPQQLAAMRPSQFDHVGLVIGLPHVGSELVAYDGGSFSIASANPRAWFRIAFGKWLRRMRVERNHPRRHWAVSGDHLA
jgi:hypothetical protein